MRNLALGDVTPDDLRLMKEEDETLFVEHKSSLGGEGYKVAEAVASFANTLGGWVLIGLDDDGEPTGWSPPESVTDRVRQILDYWLDPLPAFAAQVRADLGYPIGLIRVYESTDTPHVLRNGKVVVRSVAEVRDQTRVYRPGGVDTQLVLRQLAERGRRAMEDARIKLETAGLMLSAFGILPPSTGEGHVSLRAAPLVGDRLRDLAVSTSGRELLDGALRELGAMGENAATTLRPAASGLVCELQPRSHLLDGMDPLPRSAVAASDAAGVVGVAFRVHRQSPNMQKPLITLDGFRNGIIAPLLHALVGILDRGELFGRSILELRIGHLGQYLRMATPSGQEAAFPSDLPLGAEVALPLDPDRAEVEALADQWRDDLGRAMGFDTLRPVTP